MTYRRFAPRVRARKHQGRTVYEVDCRVWADRATALGYPVRKRFTERQEADEYLAEMIAASTRSQGDSIHARWLTPEQAEVYTGMPYLHIERFVPAVHKGEIVRYDIRDLDTWMEGDRQPSMDEELRQAIERLEARR